MTKRFISIILFLLTLALVVSCGGGEETAEDAGNYKLAAIFPGTITDADYNTLGYNGIQKVGMLKEVRVLTIQNQPVGLISHFQATDFAVQNRAGRSPAAI